MTVTMATVSSNTRRALVGKQYIVIESESDKFGKASFTMFWSNDDGVDNPGPGQIPRRRAQCFRAVPEEYVKRGAIIVASEAEAKRLAWNI